MSKVKKRALSLLLAFAMVFTAMPEIPVLAGQVGNKIMIIFDQAFQNGVILVSGDEATVITGRASMSNASDSDAAPWATTSNAEFIATSNNASVDIGAIKIKEDGTFSVAVSGTNDSSIPIIAYVTIGYEGLGTNTIKVTVEAAEPVTPTSPPEVTKVVLSPESLNLKVGGKAEEIVANITYKATPTDAQYTPKVEWIPSAGDENLVKMTRNGNAVTVEASSTVTEPKRMSISAKVNGKDSDNKCVVTITPEGTKDVLVTDVKLNPSEVTLVEGESTVVEATISPENASNKNVSWLSSDTKIATVEKITEGVDKGKGKIVGVKPGKATVTVTTEDGKWTAECEVTVKAKSEPETPVDVKGVKIVDLTGTEVKNTQLSVNSEMELECVVDPVNATYSKITWVSSDEEVLTVTPNNEVAVLKAKKASDKEVTVSANVVDKDNKVIKTATCTVKVISGVIKVTGIKLDKDSLSMEKGDEEALTATVLPTNATDKTVTWTSNNKDVATVSKDGIVKAVNTGFANITAETANGIKATCRVEVKEFAFHLSRTAATVKANKTEKVSRTLNVIIDSKVNNMSQTSWEISENDVASIVSKSDLSATIEFLPNIAKETKVTVTAEINGKSAQCVYTVIPADKEISGNDPSAKADALLDELENLDFEGMTETQKVAKLKEVVNTAKSILRTVANQSSTDLNAVEAISAVEEKLVEVAGDYVGAVEDLIAPVEGFGTDIKVTGALINALEAALKQGKKVIPVFKVASAANAEEAEKKIADKVKGTSDIEPMAIDIELSFKDKDGKIIDVSLTQDVIITLKVPGRFAGITKLVMWHFHGNGDPTAVKVKLTDGNNMSFAVRNFSTFVLAEGTVNNGSHSGGGGGGSSRGSSGGGSSTGNLVGTWVQDATGWWFKTTTNGYPANQWAKINNKWYHFNEAGYMQTGWLNDNGAWYWLNADGSMAESVWVNVNGLWYYLHVGGRMLSSQWFLYNGQWYYLNADGSMAVSTTTPDGSVVDANGVWVQ